MVIRACYCYGQVVVSIRLVLSGATDITVSRPGGFVSTLACGDAHVRVFVYWHCERLKDPPHLVDVSPTGTKQNVLDMTSSAYGFASL